MKPLLLVLALQTLNCTQSAHKPKSKSSKGHLRLRGGGGGLVGWWLYKGRASILQPTDSQLLPREHQGDQSSSCRCIFSGCIINDYFCLLIRSLYDFCLHRCLWSSLWPPQHLAFPQHNMVTGTLVLPAMDLVLLLVTTTRTRVRRARRRSW